MGKFCKWWGCAATAAVAGTIGVAHVTGLSAAVHELGGPTAVVAAGAALLHTAHRMSRESGAGDHVAGGIL